MTLLSDFGKIRDTLCADSMLISANRLSSEGKTSSIRWSQIFRLRKITPIPISIQTSIPIMIMMLSLQSLII